MSEIQKKARVIAFYLPQFHPIPENDKWWGKGFTEWTNVGKTKPLFKGHYQPRVPADLGYYDLRLPEVREAQAEMARYAGIEGFCYYHYWFGNGKRLLERPFNEVLQSGKPDFPFCLCWANHSWSNNTWLNSSKRVGDTLLMEQQYLGDEDYINHFYEVLPAFKDKRYIRVDGKPMFSIYDPHSFHDVSRFIEVWRGLAAKNGLNGIHFVSLATPTLTFKVGNEPNSKRKIPDLNGGSRIYNQILNLGFDALNSFPKRRAEMCAKGKFKDLLLTYLRRNGFISHIGRVHYKNIINNWFTPEDYLNNVYPTIIPQWDRTPRAVNQDLIYMCSTPELFKIHVQNSIEIVKGKTKEHQIIILKSWNEWAEGNYVEPDLRYGYGYLNALRESIFDN